MSSTAPAVHLCLLRPWQQAVDWFFPGDDDDPDVDDLTWQTPSTFAAGDIMVYVADAPSPAIIQVETLSSGSEGEGISASPETEWGPYSAGLSLKAIERRVDDYLPMAPATLAEPLAQRFLTALEAEASDPSLWRDVDDSWCRLGHSDDPPPAPPFGPHTCAGCGEEFTPERVAETHYGSGDDPAFTDSSAFAVCADCHGRLHKPLPDTLADLVFEQRPPCPACSAMHTLEVMWGMPPGPPGPCVVLAGCDVTGTILELRCAACGYEWSDDDDRYPRATDAGGGDRVRARLGDFPPQDFPPSPRQRPGRLVVGRYHPHHVDGAWESGTRHLIIGVDRKHYIVDPATIRWPDPTNNW